MLKYHIQTVELTSGEGSIVFNSVPQDFTDLYVSVSARCTGTGNTLNITFNGNTSGYTNRALQGNGSASSTFANFNRYSALIGMANETSNTFGSSNIYIPNYTSSSNKSYSADGVSENNATQASYQAIIAGLWSNTSPITSIAFTPLDGTFVAGSTISLYGVKRGSDGVTLPAAIGGIVTTSGGYTIHTFNTSGTFTAFRPLECEYLVVGGGGGGMYDRGGAGGAGGYRSSVNGELSGGNTVAEPTLKLAGSTGLQVLVGAGGSGGTSYEIIGIKGNNSSLGSITSVGALLGSITSVGGGFGASGGTAASSGGSGGGAFGQDLGRGNLVGGANTAGQGFAGGNGIGPTRYHAAGGGGAAAAGANAGSNAGNGGAGLSSSINGTLTFRAGGGGGGANAQQPGLNGTGGIGGGGNGGRPGANGTALTGGGGGGGTNSPQAAGGNGGSGVVIIRYLTP